MALTKKRTAILASLGGIGTVGVLGFALAGSPAQAEDPAPSPSSSAAAGTTQADPQAPDPQAERAKRQDELAGALATELGIDKAKVAAALEKVQTAEEAKAKADRSAALKTRLDAAVKAGKLTQEQADAILKASEAGVLGGPGGFGGGFGGGPGRGFGGGFGGRHGG